MNRRRRLFRAKRRGQALIYVGLVMTTLLAFALVVADVGLLFSYRRAMQNAVDAAALAAAQNLPTVPNNDDPNTGARPVACDYATIKNAVSGMTVDCSDQGPDGTGSCSPSTNPTIDILICQTYKPNDSVRVTAHKPFQPIQLPGFGWVTANIKTQATAVVGSLHSTCVDPLFQTPGLMGNLLTSSGVVLNKLTVMRTNVQNTTTNTSVTLLLQVGSSSSKTDAWGAIGDPTRCYASGAPQTSGTVAPNPGNGMGQFKQGMQSRQNAWTAQNNCPDPVAPDYLQSDGTLWNGSVALTPQTCYRMMVIPLINADAATVQPTQPYPILGFLVFYIAYWCGQNGGCTTPAGHLNFGEISGYYVQALAVGDQNFQTYDGYGTKVVALIQ